jgi:hypothetical protein
MVVAPDLGLKRHPQARHSPAFRELLQRNPTVRQAAARNLDVREDHEALPGDSGHFGGYPYAAATIGGEKRSHSSLLP